MVFVSSEFDRSFSSNRTITPVSSSPAELRTVPSIVIASACGRE